MTNKEKLKYITDNVTPLPDSDTEKLFKHLDELYEALEELDKVLDKQIEEAEKLLILKKSIYNKEIHKRKLSEPIGEEFMILGISVKGNDNVRKIKEWIDK